MSEVEVKSIEDRVRVILGEQFCVDAGEIKLDANMSEAYHGDSLDQVEVTMSIEDEFGLEIPDDEMWSFTTAQQIIDYLTAKV